MAIRILMIDDHDLVYQGVAAVLAIDPELVMLPRLADPRIAHQVAMLHKPDVALVDVCMPGCNGVEVTVRLRESVPSCRILALSAYDDACLVEQMVDAGARGYLLKRDAGKELLKAIRAVHAGRIYVHGVSLPGPAERKRLLSEGEMRLLRLIAEDKKTGEIGEVLGISVKTVDNYRRRIMDKLGVSGSTALVRCAMVLGRGDDAAEP